MIETRFTSLVKNVRDHSIFAMDQKGHVTSWNVEAERILGFKEAEVLGRHFSLIFTDADKRDGVPEHELSTALSDGRAEDERWHLRKGGERFWALGIVTPIYDASGGHTGFSKVLRDMTDRKRTEEHLRRSHDTFHHLIQNNPFGVYVVDTDFRLQQVSAGAQKVFANVPRPLLGRDFAEVLRTVWAEPFASDVVACFRHTLDTGEPFVSPSTVERRADVEQVEAYDWRIERLTLPDGRFGVVCYFYDLSERQRWESALRDSEERFRLMADAVPQIVWITDADGRIQFFNRRWGEYTGLDYVPATSDDVAAAVIHPEDRAATGAAFAAALRSGGTFAVEHRIRSAAGEYRWFLVRGEPHRDPKTGQITRWFGASVDIHDRRRAEEDRERVLRALDNERSKLVAVIEKAPAFMATLRGPEHVLELANEQYYKLIGRRDVVGQRVRDALPEVVAQGFIDLLDNVYRTGEPFVGNEVPVVLGPTGAAEARVVNFVYQALRDPDGGVGGIFVHGIDVTEVVRARHAAVAREELLRTSQERLAFSVEAGELGTFYCPMPLGRIEWNATCKAHFFLPPDAEVDFDRFYAMLHPEDRERTRRAVEQAVHERRGYDIEYRTVAPDGRTRWVRAKGRAYHDAGGNPVRFDGVTLDITDQKHAEAERQALLDRERAARAEAERAGRMKDEFLATLSHELRTPLNAILGWSQILAAGRPDAADLAEGLGIIERNARAQTQIIEDLLDMSRIISGKVRLDVQRLDLASVVRAAVETVKPAADAKRVRLWAVLDPLAGPVSGDPNRLQQVFWNLLTNAVKFTPKGGQVQVLVERVNSHLEVSVIDTGEGIAPEFLPHVFDRLASRRGHYP